MDMTRTPDERFRDLDGYPFAPHYVEVKADDGTVLRVHYVDEGPRGAAPIVLMHGNPSWSYLYRKIILRLVAHGHRVLARTTSCKKTSPKRSWGASTRSSVSRRAPCRGAEKPSW
jgi:pimeloyl-ACP methyl ester carboxylesterase